MPHLHVPTDTSCMQMYLDSDTQTLSSLNRSDCETSLKCKNFLSQPWSVAAHADDIAIISSSRDDHRAALAVIDQSCSDIGLMVCPDKCVSFAFVGEKHLNCAQFDLQSGCTHNISSGPSTYLGQFMKYASRIIQTYLWQFLQVPLISSCTFPYSTDLRLTVSWVRHLNIHLKTCC